MSPANHTVFDHYPRTTTLVWSEVPGPSGYAVEWDYNEGHSWASDRTGVFCELHTTEPVATFQFVGAQPGRWRVWAIDAAGAPGPKSAWSEFTYTK